MSDDSGSVRHSALVVAEALRALASALPDGPARQRAWAGLTDAILDEEPELFGAWFVQALDHFAFGEEDGASPA